MYRRPVPPPKAMASLCEIPGIGPALASDLYGLGISSAAELHGRSPQKLYADLCAKTGAPVDRCVLYAFRCAVYFATEPKPDPDLLRWWRWKDSPSQRLPKQKQT